MSASCIWINVLVSFFHRLLCQPIMRLKAAIQWKLWVKKNLPYRSETFSLKSAIKVRGKRTEDLRLILLSNIGVALQHQLLPWEGFIKINLVTTFWGFFSLEVKTRPSKATVDGRVNWAKKDVQMWAVCDNSVFTGLLYLLTGTSLSLWDIRSYFRDVDSTKLIKCFHCLILAFLNTRFPFWFSCRMKEIHASLAHCLGPDVFAAIFRNWTLGIRFVRYSGVILHRIMKFSQNWGASDGSEGLVLLVNTPSCWLLTMSTWWWHLHHNHNCCCRCLKHSWHQIRHPWTAVMLQHRRKMHMLFSYLD